MANLNLTIFVFYWQWENNGQHVPIPSSEKKNSQQRKPIEISQQRCNVQAGASDTPTWQVFTTKNIHQIFLPNNYLI